MTRKEWNAVSEQNIGIYSGILFHNQVFGTGDQRKIRYDFKNENLKTLALRYDLEAIAGRGSDFTRARRLMHYLAPRLTHCSWYDNHVPCNALDLLEYSLNKPEQGINCLNKAKILQECCMSQGIHARRVGIMPFSPYDFDNHVVTEIYDRQLESWIMLDPTTDGYFMDGEGNPLSLLEMRHRFANDLPVTFVPATARKKDYEALRKKYPSSNAYICKNLFYFLVDAQCGFGEPEERLIVCPEGYSVRENQIQNTRFRINHMPEEYADFIPTFRERLERLEQTGEKAYTHVSCMTDSPLENQEGDTYGCLSCSGSQL